MKRTALKRFVGLANAAFNRIKPGKLGIGSSLKRTPFKCQRKALRKRSEARQSKQDRWNAITAAKIQLGACCAVCRCANTDTNRLEGHHILPAGRGGSWTLFNHLLVCRECHERIHAFPLASEDSGWLISGHVHVTEQQQLAPSQRGVA